MKKVKNTCQSYTLSGVRCQLSVAAGGSYCYKHINNPREKPAEKKCVLCDKIAALNKACCPGCHKGKPWRYFFRKKALVDGVEQQYVMEFLNTSSGEYTQILLEDIAIILARKVESSGFMLRHKYDIKFATAKEIIALYDKYYPDKPLPVTDKDKYTRNLMFNIDNIFAEFMAGSSSGPGSGGPEHEHESPPHVDKAQVQADDLKFLEVQGITNRDELREWLKKHHPDRFQHIEDESELQRINDLFVKVHQASVLLKH